MTVLGFFYTVINLNIYFIDIIIVYLLRFKQKWKAQSKFDKDSSYQIWNKNVENSSNLAGPEIS